MFYSHSEIGVTVFSEAEWSFVQPKNEQKLRWNESNNLGHQNLKLSQIKKTKLNGHHLDFSLEGKNTLLNCNTFSP